MRLGNPRVALANAYETNKFGATMAPGQVNQALDAAKGNLKKLTNAALAAHIVIKAEDQAKDKVDWLKACYDPHCNRLIKNRAVSTLFKVWLNDKKNARVSRETVVRVSQMAAMALKEARYKIMTSDPLYSGSDICNQMSVDHPAFWVASKDKMNFNEVLLPHWAQLYAIGHDIDVIAIQPVQDIINTMREEVA